MRLKKISETPAWPKFICLKLALIFWLQINSLHLHGQVTVPGTACRNQLFEVSGDAAAVGEVSWDFCEGDLLLAPTFQTGTANNFNIPVGTSLIKANGNWYGFICSLSNNTLFRIDFGTSLSNSSPVVNDLGNLGGLLNGPQDIKVVEFQSNYYAFVYNRSVNKLIRINLGTNIETSTATASQVISGSGIDNGGVDIEFDGTNWVAAISNINTITLVNLGNSPANDPSPQDILTTSIISGVSYIADIKFVREGGVWYGFVIGYSSWTLHQLTFGSSLFVDPATSTVYTFGSAPYGFTLQHDNGKWIMIVATLQGNLLRLDFGSLVTNTPTYSNLGNLGGLVNMIKMDMAIDNSRWYGLTTNWNSKNFYLIQFPQSTPSFNRVYSSSSQDTLRSGQAGTYNVSFYYKDLNGVNYVQSQQISVSSNFAPVLNFSTSSICENVNGVFSSTSDQPLTSVSWSFGAYGSSNNLNPSVTFPTAGDYPVKLEGLSTNGCYNIVEKNVSIYHPPSSTFTLPVASPLCTNQSYVFSNTSTYDVGSSPSWQWAVNGSNFSTSRDLTYLFTSSSSQSVALTASIPGCSTQSSQNISGLVDGLLVTFSSPSTVCLGSSVSFTNTTSGAISSLTWTFGDGTTSSQPNPNVTYLSTGVYSVTLSASNAAGCQNSLSKNISVYSVPQPDFTIEAPPFSCANSPSQFDNLTPPLVDSNISSWKWKFGDAVNGTSTVKNPAYTYASANNYMVSLRATTNVGCKDSIQKLITILPSPQAGFTNSAACVNQSTHFTDASSGSILLYNWHVQNADLSGPTPSYVFKSSGSFPVKLTVTANNGCLNQITKNVVVPIMPVVDFSVQAPCTGHPTVFQEINSGGSDPAVAWNWDFGQSSGTGSPISYQFPSEGGYSITMNTTRQSGCVYSSQKNISISAGPIANFTPSVFAGAAPLDVLFNNTSTADSYLWQFDDAASTTSTDTSPEFVYTQLGKYKALLTAFNNLGCSDTLSTEIDVVIPRIDIVMNNLSLTNDPNTNSSKAVVTILNSGNMPLIDPEVLIDFGGSASVKEKITGLLRPGKSIIHALGLQIVPRSLEYICAEIDVTDDVDRHNNKQCVPLSAEDVVLAPYPNPSNDGQVTIEWVGATQENVVITIFKSSGAIAFEQHLDESSAGLGQLTINTSSFGNGLYLIQFAGSKTKKTFRIMIAN